MGGYSDEDEPVADGAGGHADYEWGFSDSDEEMPDVNGGEAAGGDASEEMPDLGFTGDGDGWGSSIEFEIANAGVILISYGDEG